MSGHRTTYRSYVIDDGWNPPYEVIEEIEFKIAETQREAMIEVIKQHKNHKGDWLTDEVAERYAARSWVYRILNSNQYVGKVREIGKELQELYGVEEIEAINILFEHNVRDYVNKYYRIKNLIPRNVNPQRICDEVINNHRVVL